MREAVPIEEILIGIVKKSISVVVGGKAVFIGRLIYLVYDG